LSQNVKRRGSKSRPIRAEAVCGGTIGTTVCSGILLYFTYKHQTVNESFVSGSRIGSLGNVSGSRRTDGSGKQDQRAHKPASGTDRRPSGQDRRGRSCIGCQTHSQMGGQDGEAFQPHSRTWGQDAPDPADRDRTGTTEAAARHHPIVGQRTGRILDGRQHVGCRIHECHTAFEGHRNQHMPSKSTTRRTDSAEMSWSSRWPTKRA